MSKVQENLSEDQLFEMHECISIHEWISKYFNYVESHVVSIKLQGLHTSSDTHSYKFSGS